MSDYFQNLWSQPFYQDWMLRLATDMVHYPLVLVQTLIQIGYEPLPPTPGPRFRSLFINNVQTNTFRLQSNFSYLKYIYSVDGFLGCYRGFFPYICCHSVKYVVNHSLLMLSRYQAQYGGGSDARAGRRGHLENALRVILTAANGRALAALEDRFPPGSNGDGYGVGLYPENDSDLISLEMEVEEKVYFVNETWWRLLCSNVAVISSHPFYVIGVRCVAQFVGRELKYNSIFESIAEIFKNEGILGFFKGLVPRMIAETNFVIVSSCVIFLVKKVFNTDAREPVLKNFLLKTGAEYLANLIAAGFANPYLVVTNTMIVNNSGLGIGAMPHSRTYTSWRQAMDTLQETRQLSRGHKRFYNGPFTFKNGHLLPSHCFGPLHPPDLGDLESIKRFTFLRKDIESMEDCL